MVVGLHCRGTQSSSVNLFVRCLKEGSMQTFNLWSKSLTTLLIVLTVVAVASAQSITGSVSGVVTDATGGCCPAPTSLSLATRLKDQEGHCQRRRQVRICRRPARSYTLRIEKEGFQTHEQKGVVLSANENLALGEMKLHAWPGEPKL